MKHENNRTPDTLFSISREAVDLAGEDSWCYSSIGTSTLIGVFDGSGGSGGRKYDNYSGKSGAYVVSRAVSGAALEWFHSQRPAILREYIDQALSVCKKYADPEIKLKGSIRKDFPTTLAMMTIDDSNEMLDIFCYWAGDSRCYLLDSEGLHQITKDDVNTADPMENLTEDGVLTNVINASTGFQIHERAFQVSKPSIVLCATDGCFGYLPSPMHFEFMLLDSLHRAASISGWKEKIDNTLQGRAGDDYSMCVAGYGFDSFSDIKAFFEARRQLVEAQYITRNTELIDSWDDYKGNYLWYE